MTKKNKNLEPETVAWEIVNKVYNKLIDKLGGAYNKLDDLSDKWEINPLIRRKDAEDFYSKKERQKILEIIEEEPCAIKVFVTDNNDLEMKFPAEEDNPLTGIDWDNVVLISKEDLKQKIEDGEE